MKPVLYAAAILIIGLSAQTIDMRAQAPAAPAVIVFNVTSTVDDIDDNPGNGLCHTLVTGPAGGACTLRAAVMEANRTSAPAATITIPAGTYTLTISATPTDGEADGDLNLTAPASGNPVISITGAGANKTIIDANQIDRVLSVAAGRSTLISGVAIRNGNLSAPNTFGGGINTYGVLTVTNSVLSGNFAGSGGGGIFNGGNLTVLDSTFRENSSATYGGGLDNIAIMLVRDSTVFDNLSYDRGGIYNDSTLNVVNSTIGQNNANHDGGGIKNHAGNTSVYNTSIVFNDADADAVGGGSGGGVFNFANPSVLFNLRNTLVVGNIVQNAPIDDDCANTLYSYGRNLFTTLTPCTIVTETGSWSAINSKYLFSPLQNNGGPTQTYALLQSNSAIDGGDPGLGCVDFAGVLATDQRGAARVTDGDHDGNPVCDVGAFEYRPPLLLPLIRR